MIAFHIFHLANAFIVAGGIFDDHGTKSDQRADRMF
jgi:hypothetical protein